MRNFKPFTYTLILSLAIAPHRTNRLYSSYNEYTPFSAPQENYNEYTPFSNKKKKQPKSDSDHQTQSPKSRHNKTYNPPSTYTPSKHTNSTRTKKDTYHHKKNVTPKQHTTKPKKIKQKKQHSAKKQPLTYTQTSKKSKLKLTMTEHFLTLKPNDTYTLHAQLNTKNYDSSTFLWKSTNNSIVNVNKGSITCLKSGFAIVYVTYKDLRKAACTIKVCEEGGTFE